MFCGLVDVCELLYFYFFFRAGEGIRDLVWSCLLGDVYQSQWLHCVCLHCVWLHCVWLHCVWLVSDTHLTLPTNREVYISVCVHSVTQHCVGLSSAAIPTTYHYAIDVQPVS